MSNDKARDSYESELIQVAAVALAALQHYESGRTGLAGYESWLQNIGRRVYHERQYQENKWGERKGGDMKPRDWLTVLVRELGEMAEAI